MSGNRKWVLLADDEPEIRSSLKELIDLSFSGVVKVVESANGIEATAKITQQMFDCIITDFKMPRKDGRALITSIRQNGFNNRTPIIVLTGYPDKKITEQYPFVYLLEKPFKHEELIKLLTTQLKIGSGSGRLAADILNSLIQATGAFMMEVCKVKTFEIESPKAKAQGTQASCDYLSKIEFLSDDVFHYFSILASKEALTTLAKNTNQGSAKLEKISYALGHAILKYSIRGVHTLKLQRMNVSAVSGKDVGTYLESKTGVLVTIKVEGMTLEVFASTKPRKKNSM